ncbi:MAG: dynamin family protein [Sciscionella sp.]
MSQSGVALPDAVRQTRQRLVTLLAEMNPEAARWVEQVRVDRAEIPAVVVVGETNRGKSSLVNALLARRGLSPVDADVATATYLVFGYGEELIGRACYPGRHEPVRFDAGELVRWVSATRDLPEGQLPPRYVEVDAPIPLLRRLRIVDTPGVGGLDSMHGELAREASAQARALLFVVDAAAPFTATELEFLHDVSERVETVVFALAKIDAYRGWRQVLEADRALLAEHAPRFSGAEFLAASARMFEMAAAAPTPDAAAMLRERSGVPRVQVRLQELVAGRSAMLAEANALRALSSALGELHVRLTVRRRVLLTGQDEVAALRARRDELTTERRSSTRGWQVKLRGDVQRARVESNHEVARQVRDMQSWFRQAIDAADRTRLPNLPGEVDAALHLVSGRISERLAGRLSQLTESVLAELFSPEEVRMLRAQVARGARQPVVLRPPERRSPTPEDKLLVFMGMSGGFGAARIASLPFAGVVVGGLINPLVLVPTIVVGLGAGWWMARTRKHTAEKQHMKQWLTESIADARATIDQAVSEQLISAEQQLSLALDEALGRRIEAIEGELKTVDVAMKLRAGERSAQLAEVTQRIGEVTSGLTKVADLLDGIRKVRG